ncbi:Ada metal-binding domain-containing protein [Methanolobus sp. ZRKC2]|uniref:Ada metal-binding domain-containing protein n=1 Tax=Methanolobus sp. ZRKC2 TaxID=3125783 RepID=UPI003246A128
MVLKDNEKWDAVVSCDETYDGNFFYGVRTTGVFCRPSCKSRTPRRKNVEFFKTIDEAYTSGLRPCKKCRPDLLENEKMMHIAEQVRTICDTYFLEDDKLLFEFEQMDISAKHLNSLYYRKFSINIMEYVLKLRAKRAIELISGQ